MTGMTMIVQHVQVPLLAIMVITAMIILLLVLVLVVLVVPMTMIGVIVSSMVDPTRSPSPHPSGRELPLRVASAQTSALPSRRFS